MKLKARLEDIWGKDYMFELPEFIKERGFNYSLNNTQKDILITGINPSFRNGEISGSTFYDFEAIANDNRYDRYWTSLKKIVQDENINLIDKTAYLDIFYFREMNQLVLSQKILPAPNGLSFIADQLNLTQHIIEDIIKPKVIIVKNKESSAYWGKLIDKGIVWMGYDLEFIKETNFGSLYSIKGLVDIPGRIAPEIKESNLISSIILFTNHINQYTKKEKRPTPLFINELLNKSNL